jgi:hypothetical protein
VEEVIPGLQKLRAVGDDQSLDLCDLAGSVSPRVAMLDRRHSQKIAWRSPDAIIEL